ncbi:MAG: ABC transporter permease [Prevotellaceae bacterium]|jgi:ABC-type antimicrobial peptide transport system permease subunit|nr:ABC transporter permease [Prevotellaceae bacterium]
MNILSDYIRTAIYNIWHNKAYALFCLFGTALTFIFVIILLQLIYIVTGNEPPLENADRTVKIEWFYGDAGPEHSWEKKYYFDEQGVIQLSNMIKGYEVYGISHSESVNPIINGQLKTVEVNFVNPDYWQVKGYNFIVGRSFTETDYSSSHPVAVIRESNARKYFGSPESSINQEIEFQKNTYRIIGVVADFSILAADEWSGIWVPHKYNRGTPSGWLNYAIEYMFPKNMPVDEMKENVLYAVKNYFGQQEKEIVEPTELQTNREQIVEKLGGEVFRYGVIVLLLALLIIPAVNIITINVANADKQSESIAVRRALGASKIQVFFQLMSEITLLVLCGTLIGLLLSYPVLYVVETVLLDYGVGEGSKLLGKMNYWVILLGILPVSLIFSLMSGGIPAWKIVRRSISGTLKGEPLDDLTNKYSRFTGIYIEQALVFITLMICMVSILKKIELYKTPGMLDTSNTLIFGYATSAMNKDFKWDDVFNVLNNLKTINEELKQKTYVEAISKNSNFLPYGTFSDAMKHCVEADGKRIENIDFMAADPATFKVLRPSLDEGEWFSDDANYEHTPCVITRQLADSLGWGEATGRHIAIEHFATNAQVIGVLSGIKKNVFEESKMGVIILTSLFERRSATISGYYCARLTNNSEKDNLTNEYYNLFKKRIGVNSVIEPIVSDIERYKTEQIIKNTSSLIAQTVPTVFFLIFGFIGSFGLFWLNTEKRKSELALRRAIGSTKVGLIIKILKESLILTLLSAIPGIILAFFIYNLGQIEILGIGLSLLIMIVFSVFSAWYPAFKVSRLSPAESLHYD